MEVSTMATRTTGEAVALHNAGEALTLGSTGDVDLLHVGESRHGLLVARLVLGSVLDANLTQIAGRLDALLGEMAAHGLVDLLRLDGAKAQLHSLVAVGGLRLDLAHRVRLGLDHGHGDELVLLVEDLGHADFLTINCVNHSLTPLTA